MDPLSRLPDLTISRAFEESFQYALGGNGVEPGLQARPSRTGSAQESLGLVRGQPLVDEFGAGAEAALQALREAAGEPADRVLAAIGVNGKADHQQRRVPFRNEPLDRRKARAVVRGRDHGQGMSETGLEVSDRDADALRAEVECEDGSRPRVSGER